MRLQDKFKHVFILPLICGIMLSIILTVIILTVYSKKFADDDLITRMRLVEEEKNVPILYATNNFLFRKFQTAIYSLQSFKAYYDFYGKTVKEGFSKYNKETIDKYVFNVLKLQGDNYYKIIKSIEEMSPKNSSYLDHAFWSLDNKISDLNDNRITAAFRKQIHSLTLSIPIMRSIYETNKDNPSTRLDSIYYANKKTNLMFLYPILKNSPDYYYDFKNTQNVFSCKTETGVRPDYYYFKCRDWWIKVEETLTDPQVDDIIITHPYKFSGLDKYGITLCIKFYDIFSQEVDSNKNNQLGVFCVDIDMTDLYKDFEYFNKQLSGYFFILRVNSVIPIYYPSIERTDFTDIAMNEFNVNTAYFVEELENFKDTTVPELIAKNDTMKTLNEIKTKDFKHGNFTKNGSNYDYVITPVMLYTDPKTSTPNHMLSIVYINRRDSIKDSIMNFQKNLYSRLIVQILLFTMMGSILVLIAWYLIISIALNIVKPIKNLKYLIQGMNPSIISSEVEETTIREGSRNINTASIHPKENHRSQDVNPDYNPINDYTNNGDQENNENFELDEETLGIRSEEMDKLFNILLKLKNVLTFTTNNKTVCDKDALVNYVNAKYTFGEVSNDKGKNVCDSNVGNLAIRCNKYDKAIFHLIQSIPELNNQEMNKGKNKTRVASKTIISDLLKKITGNLQLNVTSTKLTRNHKKTISKDNLNITAGINSSIGGYDGSSINEVNQFNNVDLLSSNNTFNDNDKLTQLVDHGKRDGGNGNILNFRKNLSDNFIKKNETSKKDIAQIVIIESRYPKLIYAYKKLFKNLRLIIKNISKDGRSLDEVAQQMIYMDLYVFRETHSLEAYENILKKYLIESENTGDKRRVAEALLEYIEFLIIYKLKTCEFYEKEIKVDNLNNSSPKQNPNLYSTANPQENINNIFVNPYQENKKKILKEIHEYFQSFDLIYQSLKLNCSSEYFKSFMDLIRSNRRDHLEIIETPFLVLYQKSNYLKGKVAKICGHLDKALEFFHKSRESLIICDASIIKKSIKQIVNMMNMIKEDIDQDIEFKMENGGKSIYENQIKDSKKDTTSTHKDSVKDSNKDSNKSGVGLGKTHNLTNPEKKIVERIESLKEKSSKIESYIIDQINKLDNFKYVPKDMLILIDVSDRMKSDPKKLERASKTANSFLEMYITAKDRFGIFVYSSIVNPILSLTEKNHNTYVYLKKIMDDILQDTSSGGILTAGGVTGAGALSKEGVSQNPKSCLCKAVTFAYDYLCKKNPDPRSREKWIIIFTDSFNIYDNTRNDMQIFNELRQNRYKTKEQVNVIAVGINMPKDESDRLQEGLKNISNKSDFVDYDNINIFASIMKIHGDVKIDVEFSNERYESDKIKRY